MFIFGQIHVQRHSVDNGFVVCKQIRRFVSAIIVIFHTAPTHVSQNLNLPTEILSMNSLLIEEELKETTMQLMHRNLNLVIEVFAKNDRNGD